MPSASRRFPLSGAAAQPGAASARARGRRQCRHCLSRPRALGCRHPSVAWASGSVRSTSDRMRREMEQMMPHEKRQGWGRAEKTADDMTGSRPVSSGAAEGPDDNHGVGSMIREINANVIGHMRDERVRVASHACRACPTHAHVDGWRDRERQKIKSRTVISKYNDNDIYRLS